VTIGWIGSPSTAHYLDIVTPVLQKLASSYTFRAVAIGARPDQVAGTPFVSVPWAVATEVEELGQIDIGIMPLVDSPWERGKCGYKLIQYMALGIPVVASPVGVNRQIVEEGSNGYLASDEDSWSRGLACLLESGDLRSKLGARGREIVEARYTLQVQAPILSDLIAATIGSRSTG
jgi:glycosyltransferase involved in cell wall biosynthesis